MHSPNLLVWRGRDYIAGAVLEGKLLLKIIAVCTGNVCRSPLAEQLLSKSLAGLDVRVFSAGTRAREGMAMTKETADVAVSYGASAESVERHAAKTLTYESLATVDLALAMAREHRREIVELNPSLTRRTFTLRELSRLSAEISDQALLAEAALVPELSSPSSRLTAMLALVASRRGTTFRPGGIEEDDIEDPYRRSLRTYERSAGQLTAALPPVERLIRLALSTSAA